MIKDLILDVLFPKFCVGCGREGKYLCEKCELFVSENSLICPVCGNSSFTGETHFNCKRRYSLDGLISIWDYDGLIKEAIHNIKYKGMFDLIDEFADKAFNYISKDPSKRFDSFLSFLGSENTQITYVPMFKRKEKQRGFNQSKLIAKKISAVSNKKMVSLIKKAINTESQTKLEKEERFKNVKGSFRVVGVGLFDVGVGLPNPKKEGEETSPLQNVLLVDDVFTTGATMRECCKVLKLQGVKEVWGFVLARTP